jgi:hypothetical protein
MFARVDSALARASGVRTADASLDLMAAMERTISIGVVCFFAAWFVLTIFAQADPIARKLQAFDKFGLLPKWTFFAPHPGHFDYHLLYRLSGSPGEREVVREWRQLSGLSGGPYIPFLWNPQRRVTKSILDVVNALMLAQRIFRNNPELLQFTTEYLLLLHLIECEAPRGAKVQFALVQTCGIGVRETQQLVFLSKHHRTAS